MAERPRASATTALWASAVRTEMPSYATTSLAEQHRAASFTACRCRADGGGPGRSDASLSTGVQGRPAVTKGAPPGTLQMWAASSRPVARGSAWLAARDPNPA